MKRISEPIRDAFNKNQLKSWLYAATTLGTFVVFPGNAYDLGPDNDLATCGFTPQQRPWYIRAASGKKDIVFLFDTSGLTSANSVLRSALTYYLSTLDRRDFVAVVPFGSKVSVLGGADSLRSADTAFRTQLVQEINRLSGTSDTPDLLAGLTKAFDLLSGTETSDCFKHIVVMLGTDPKCFDACKRTNSLAACECTSKIVQLVNARQQKLIDDGKPAASIATFTEGSGNDGERVARTIVCEARSSGVWTKVLEGDRPENAMVPFATSIIKSVTDNASEAVASEMYEDAFGLGDIFTMAQPIYSRTGRKLVGVVGTDVTVAEVRAIVGDSAGNMIDELSQEGENCRNRSERSSCQLQSLRSGSRSGQCADILPGSRGKDPGQSLCYRVGDVDTLYIRLFAIETWSEAQRMCAELGDGGSFAKVDSGGKNTFLAGAFSLDGSWIGLRAEQGEGLKWEDGSAVGNVSYGFSEGVNPQTLVNEIHEKEISDACVSADRRGTTGNWNVVSCNAKRDFMCEVAVGSVAASTHCSGNKTFVNKQADFTPVNDVNCDEESESNECSPADDEATRNASPFCAEETNRENVGEFERFCCGGEADRGPEETCRISSGAIAGIAVAGVFVFLLVAVIAWFFIRRRRRKARASTAGVAAEEGKEGKGKWLAGGKGEKKDDGAVGERLDRADEEVGVIAKKAGTAASGGVENREGKGGSSGAVGDPFAMPFTEVRDSAAEESSHMVMPEVPDDSDEERFFDL